MNRPVPAAFFERFWDPSSKPLGLEQMSSNPLGTAANPWQNLLRCLLLLGMSKALRASWTRFARIWSKSHLCDRPVVAAFSTTIHHAMRIFGKELLKAEKTAQKPRQLASPNSSELDRGRAQPTSFVPFASRAAPRPTPARSASWGPRARSPARPRRSRRVGLGRFVSLGRFQKNWSN